MKNEVLNVIKRQVGVVSDDEIWKQVPEALDGILASSQGRILKVTNEDGVVNVKLLSQRAHKTSKGYYLAISFPYIGKNGKLVFNHKLVHVVIAETFLDKPSDWDTCNYEVNHDDGDKTNNAASNLEWVTRSENLIHAYETGLRTDSQRVKVIDLTTKEEQVFRSLSALAEHFDLKSQDQAQNVIFNAATKPYLNRYVFELLDGFKKTNKEEHVDIIAKDHVTGDTIVSESGITLYRKFGVRPGTVSRSVANGTRLTSGYTFRKYPFEGEWPVVTVEEAKASRASYLSKSKPREKRFGVRVLDYLTGKETTYATYSEAGEKLNISPSTLQFVVGNGDRPFRNYGIKHLDDETPFKEYPPEIIPLLPRIKSAVVVFPYIQDTETDTTKVYTSIRDFAVQHGFNPISASNAFRRGAIFQSRYKLLKTFKL